MKKIIIKLLKKNFDLIKDNWINALLKLFKNQFTKSQLSEFVESTLNAIIQVLEEGDYSPVDNYLIDIYNLFRNVELDLLEISQLFSNGRISIHYYIDKGNDSKFDHSVLVEFIEEIIEQLFARYSMLHQESLMKEISLDRDRLAAKFEANQQYLKNILHISDQAIMIIDQNEKFIAWNKGAEKIFGYSENEVIGKPSSLLMNDDQKFTDELNFIKKEVNENGHVTIAETERVTKSGKLIPVELNVTRLPSKNGEYVGRSVIIKDFTEVTQLQQQVNQSEKLAVIGQLAAGVAHEIGNPLASISSIVQILQRKSNDMYFGEQLAHIKENIDRISKIVRELVDFSRPPGFEKKVIQITDVIKTALGIVRYDKRVKKVEFRTDLDPNLPLLEIVPDQILQVFINILINALDAINGEGIIEVDTKFDDDFIYIDIIDDGCGMPQDVVKQIFDPFYTTKEVGKGTGLGLSVSYGIIKKFKGDISVKSDIDKGSCFTIKLPLEIN